MNTEKIQTNIEKFGWHFLHIFDPNGIKNSFSYSVGFEESFGQPEILIFGLKKDAAHGILTDIADDLRNGLKLEVDTKMKDVIGGDFEVMFKPVQQKAFSEYLGTAVNYYNKPFRAWVMFWPDKSNILPFEESCEVSIQDEALNII